MGFMGKVWEGVRTGTSGGLF